MKEYYVYVYCDGSKVGKYVYGSYCFEYEPIYIGKGTCSRIYAHLRPSLLYNGSYFHNTLKRLVENNCYICYKLFENLSNEEAIKYEIDLISLIGKRIEGKGSLCNITNGGEGTSGRISPMKGKNHSDSTKKKISENSKHLKPRLGYVMTEEEKRKRSSKLKGRAKGPFSEEHLKNLSESHKGKKQSEETKQKRAKHQYKKVKCLETNTVYSSIKEAGITTSLRVGISRVCRGLQHTAGGFHWMFVEGV